SGSHARTTLERRPLPRRKPQAPEPRMNPKLYQPPLLCTSYIDTARLKSEIANATGQIRPCQTPLQNPATPWVPAVPATGLRPAQPAARSARVATSHTPV